jgi:hypothetical protein
MNGIMPSSLFVASNHIFDAISYCVALFLSKTSALASASTLANQVLYLMELNTIPLLPSKREARGWGSLIAGTIAGTFHEGALVPRTNIIIMRQRCDLIIQAKSARDGTQLLVRAGEGSSTPRDREKQFYLLGIVPR